MTDVKAADVRSTALEQVRLAMGELFGAERRLRGREQHQPGDLTQSQLRALVILGKEQEVTAGELARSADLNPASVTAMLDQLELHGIIQRRRSITDRRMCMVSLTRKGAPSSTKSEPAGRCSGRRAWATCQRWSWPPHCGCCGR